MIPIPSGVRVWIATGHTDMRCGMNSLALLGQETFKRDPHSGDLYVFRGKSGKLIKILWHDGSWHVALCQAAGTWPVHLALAGRWCGSDHAGSARLPDALGSDVPRADVGLVALLAAM